MSVKLFRLSYMLPAVALAGLAFAPACGGDDDDPTDIDATENDPPDASEGPDASEAPDAMSPDAMQPSPFSGTISLFETSWDFDGDPNTAPAKGASANVSFIDSSTAVEPAFGDSVVNGCVVRVLDAEGESLGTPLDEGVVSVTGTSHAAFDCTFGQGYQCVSASGTAATGSTATPGVAAEDPPLTYLVMGGDAAFDATAIGSQVLFTGFSDAAANGPNLVFAAPAGNTLITANGGDLASVATMDADGTFDLIVGDPTVFLVGGNFDFLGDATTDVTVSKPAGTNIDAIDTTINPGGTGFDLDDASADPNNFPLTAADVTFSCAGAGGDCGEDAEGLNALIVSGRSFSTAGDRIAVFQCSAIGADSVTIPEDATAAILGDSPGLVVTTVGHAAGAILGDTNVLMGHATFGQTIAPAVAASIGTNPGFELATAHDLAEQR